jgi:hypothetical protein
MRRFEIKFRYMAISFCSSGTWRAELAKDNRLFFASKYCCISKRNISRYLSSKHVISIITILNIISLPDFYLVMDVAIFGDIVQCSPYMSRCFGGIYHLHRQDRKWAEQEISVHRWLGRMNLWGYMFLRSIDSYTDYTALYPRRWQHSLVTLVSDECKKYVFEKVEHRWGYLLIAFWIFFTINEIFKKYSNTDVWFTYVCSKTCIETGNRFDYSG